MKINFEILISLDHTEWRGYRIRIQKPKRFISDYNDTEGINTRKRGISKFNNNQFDLDHKLFLGGIPITATEEEVRKICESFGQLKIFNLVMNKDSPGLNRGFCFFEYLDPRATERAIKGLDGREMGEKRLKVQRTSLNTTEGTKAHEVFYYLNS
jgi:splicing factor U2AF subunit